MDFDPSRESVSVLKVWAIFPGFLLAFWTRGALETIGNKLGNLWVSIPIGKLKNIGVGPGSR